MGGLSPFSPGTALTTPACQPIADTVRKVVKTAAENFIMPLLLVERGTFWLSHAFNFVTNYAGTAIRHRPLVVGLTAGLTPGFGRVLSLR